jgi:Domain of unknown function (DUF4112)
MRFPVTGQIDPDTPEFMKILQRVDRLAMLLDARYRIPLTRIYFGWDAVIGLVPVVGDLLMTAVSVSLIRDARRMGVQRRCVAQMGRHTLIDLLLGAVPIIGPLFDVFYRANLRNLQLLLNEIQRRQQPIGTADYA